jgi:hypothetical protein
MTVEEAAATTEGTAVTTGTAARDCRAAARLAMAGYSGIEQRWQVVHAGEIWWAPAACPGGQTPRLLRLFLLAALDCYHLSALVVIPAQAGIS